MAKSEGVNRESICTTGELAGILGLTPRRLQQLVAEGILEQEEKGTFLLGKAVTQYLLYIKGGVKSDEELKLELDKKRAEVKMKKARARREELLTAELDGSMFRKEDVEAWTTDLVYAFKGAVMALPSRVAVDVAAEENPAACGAIVTREVKLILNELANYQYDPEYYEDRIRERRKLELRFMNGQDEDE